MHPAMRNQSYFGGQGWKGLLLVFDLYGQKLFYTYPYIHEHIAYTGPSATQMNAEAPSAGWMVKFQEKADDAGVVLFLLSKSFAQSKTCRQQVHLHNNYT